MNDYLTVKEFAKEINVSEQYVYRLLKTKLKPYYKRINRKSMIHSSAICLFNEDSTLFSTNSTSLFKDVKAAPEAALDGVQQEIFSTNSTENSTGSLKSLKSTQNDNKEVETLRELIDELKKNNEELRKDKENLIKDKEKLLTESYKWQQLFLEERNKNKMLEKSDEQKQNVEIKVTDDVTENESEIIEPTAPPKKKWYEFWK